MKNKKGKGVKVNEVVPENACIIVLNWKGKKYSRGAKLQNLEPFEEDNIIMFKDGIRRLSIDICVVLDIINKRR